MPGLDRGLYNWDGVKLSQLPFTADSLVDHTHLHKGHGTFLTGAKINDVVGINVHNGKVRIIKWHTCHYGNINLMA